MRPITATARVPAPREAVFDYLSRLENHWAVAGRWIEVVAVDGDRGRVRLRGPLGLRRTADTRVEHVDAPARLEGTARLGSTRAAVAWALSARDDGATDVRLTATLLTTSPLDRVALMLGGRAWMRRLFATTLAQLAATAAAI